MLMLAMLCLCNLIVQLSSPFPCCPSGTLCKSHFAKDAQNPSTCVVLALNTLSVRHGQLGPQKFFFGLHSSVEPAAKLQSS